MSLPSVVRTFAEGLPCGPNCHLRDVALFPGLTLAILACIESLKLTGDRHLGHFCSKMDCDFAFDILLAVASNGDLYSLIAIG
jgi:hypothetical protein